MSNHKNNHNNGGGGHQQHQRRHNSPRHHKSPRHHHHEASGCGVASAAVAPLRCFFPLVVLLCILQSLSLLSSTVNFSAAYTATNASLSSSYSNLIQRFFGSSDTSHLHHHHHHDGNDLSHVMSDPLVAAAVKDYYHRLRRNGASSGGGGGGGGSNKIYNVKNGTTKISSSGSSTSSSAVQTPTRPPSPTPFFYTDPIFRHEQERIDAIPVEERCQAFGVKPLSVEQLQRLPHNTVTNEQHPNQKHQLQGRRIFFGSLIANENWDLIKAHAIEVQDVYYAIALVEANTTQSNTPRPLRYGPESPLAQSLLHSQMFGTTTHVKFQYWLHDWPDLKELNREVEQRTTVVDVWKQMGMTQDDVGILADVDEIVSRDFLRALQVCDFPKLRRPDDPLQNPPSCHAPKMVLSAIQFESSPNCIKKLEWYHPDVILGQCIEGIGDPSERIVPLREHKRQYGLRLKSYGKYDLKEYPPEVLNSTKGLYPLFSGRDIRSVTGSTDTLSNYVDMPGHGNTAVWGVAYHLHNWFDGQNMATIRHKYKTYGHPNWRAFSGPLATKDDDLDLLVRCAYSLGNNVHPEGREYYNLPNISTTFGGNRPIYFRNHTYVHERHELLQRMVREDEAIYGPSYDKETGRRILDEDE